MSKIDAISNIIQKISEDDLRKDLKSYEFIFAFDVKKKKVIEAPKGFNKMMSWKAIDYYLLNQNASADITFNNFLIKDDDGIELDLSVKLNLELKDGLSKDGLKDPIEKFIIEGKSYSNYEQFLRDVVRIKLKSYVKKYSQENQNTFIQDFFKAKKKLEGEIVDLLESFGIESLVKISSKNESQIPRILDFTNRIEVRVKDYSKLLHIKYKVEALLDPNQKNLALQAFGKENEINTKVEIALKEFISHCSYKEFLNETEEILIEPFKDKELNQILAQYGRKVDFFQINYEKDGSLEIKTETFEKAIECKIIGYDKLIKVQNYVMLVIKDPAKFKKANIKDLDKWIYENIQKVTKRILFGESYSSIVLNDSRIEESVKKDLYDICVVNGLEVDQHVVTPDLPPLRIKKEGFDIESDRTYSTKSSSVPIEVKLVLSGKIPNLQKISEYISPNIDISEEIKKTAERATKRILHNTGPHAAFMYFDILPEGEIIYDDCTDCHVSERIRKEIVADLSKFHISNPDIILNINESELIKRINRMIKGLNRVEIIVTPLTNEEDAEVITFHLDYRIVGVNQDHWDVFQASLNSEESEVYKTIEDTLKGDLSLKLRIIPIDVLRFRDVETAKNLIREVVNPVSAKIASVTGLNIQIVNFYRDATQWEELNIADTEHLANAIQQSNRNALSISHKARLEELSALNTRKLHLIKDNEDGDNDDAITDINEKIKGITDEIPSFQISKGKQHLKKLKSPEKKSFSFNDFKQIQGNTNTEEE